MELWFADRGDVCEMGRAIQYHEVTFGVQAKGGAAHFRDADGRLDLIARCHAGLASIAEDGSTLEMQIDVALAVGVGELFDTHGGILGEANDAGFFAEVNIHGRAGVGSNGGARGQGGAGANGFVSLAGIGEGGSKDSADFGSAA